MLLIKTESTGKRKKKQSELSHEVKKRKTLGSSSNRRGKSGLRERQRLGLQSGQVGGRSNEMREKG